MGAQMACGGKPTRARTEVGEEVGFYNGGFVEI
jgi:hypothetical protein